LFGGISIEADLMKIIGLGLAVLLSWWANAAPAASLSERVRSEAQKCTKALFEGDFEKFVDYTHPRVVKRVGGKAAMVAMLKGGLAQMERDGTGFLDAVVDESEEPRQVAGWLVAIVPTHVTMKVPGGRLLIESQLLAFSEDQGKTWVFIDLGPITADQFAEAFPELDGKVELPPKKDHVFQKDAA
jgi:hypothetical protein